VNPNVGQSVWLGNFITIKDLKLLDLTDIPDYIPDNIFSPDYDHDKNWASFFMDSFANEISRPVPEGVDYLNYVPTQVLTEYIRKKGYDGIKYKSSQHSSGCNYTLFCGPEKEASPDYKTIEDKRLESFTRWLSFTAFKEVYINGVEYCVRESFWGKRNFTDADFAKGTLFCAEALARGAYLHPRHNMFLSLAHTEADIDRALVATDAAFAAVAARFSHT